MGPWTCCPWGTNRAASPRSAPTSVPTHCAGRRRPVLSSARLREAFCEHRARPFGTRKRGLSYKKGHVPARAVPVKKQPKEFIATRTLQLTCVSGRHPRILKSCRESDKDCKRGILGKAAMPVSWTSPTYKALPHGQNCVPAPCYARSHHRSARLHRVAARTVAYREGGGGCPWPIERLARELRPIAAEFASELDVIRCDGDPLGMDGEQVGVPQKVNRVGLDGRMHSGLPRRGRRLPVADRTASARITPDRRGVCERAGRHSVRW